VFDGHDSSGEVHSGSSPKRNRSPCSMSPLPSQSTSYRGRPLKALNWACRRAFCRPISVRWRSLATFLTLDPRALIESRSPPSSVAHRAPQFRQTLCWEVRSCCSGAEVGSRIRTVYHCD
jgi:hypothetical protein